MSSLLFTSDRPEFMERVAKLAGGTTYREPVGGHSTKLEHLPDPHAIAAALSFARRGPDDIGPDVAYCWVLKSDAYREKVTRKLSIAMRCHELRGTGANRLAACNAAWDAMIHNRSGHSRPADCAELPWSKLLLAATGTLYTSAWDTLADAERAYSMVA